MSGIPMVTTQLAGRTTGSSRQLTMHLTEVHWLRRLVIQQNVGLERNGQEGNRSLEDALAALAEMRSQ